MAIKETPEAIQAKHEIRAWTVDGTPMAEMVAGLWDAYQGRAEQEKQAFVSALIDVAAAASLANAGNAAQALKNRA
jgi:hypothetical protein